MTKYRLSDESQSFSYQDNGNKKAYYYAKSLRSLILMMSRPARPVAGSTMKACCHKAVIAGFTMKTRSHFPARRLQETPALLRQAWSEMARKLAMTCGLTGLKSVITRKYVTTSPFRILWFAASAFSLVMRA